MKNIKIFVLLYFLLNINSTFSESSFPEPVQQAELSIYEIRKKDMMEEVVNETGFFIAPNLFVTSFQSIGRLDLENENFNDIKLFQKGQLSTLKIQKVIAISAVFDLALLETQGTSEHYLNTAPLEPARDLFTIGYSYGTLMQLKKTGSLLSEESGYCFIHQASFDHLNGASGSPVLNAEGLTVGVIYTGVTPHTNNSCATNSNKIKQLIRRYIGTNCTPFENVKECVENELNSIETLARNGNHTARHIGMYRVNAYRQIQWINSFKILQSTASLEVPEEIIEEWDHKLQQLNRQYTYWLIISAEKGSFQTQYMLSRHYDEGEGIEQNKNQAAYWAASSARQGFAPAQHIRGLHYAKGEGVKQNMLKAFDWITKAAKQRLIPAEDFLASMYYNGTEKIPPNLERFFYWTKQSAEQGYVFAQYKLSVLYSKGIGTTHNIQKSLYWIHTAAEQGLAVAQHELGLIYLSRETNLQNVQQAIHWITKAAEQNYMPALKMLSITYLTGNEYIQQNLQQAFYWTTQAAEHGDPESQYNLFTLYAKGEGTQKDLKKAIKWLEQAARQGHIRAQLALKELSPDPSIVDWLQDFFN